MLTKCGSGCVLAEKRFRPACPIAGRRENCTIGMLSSHGVQAVYGQQGRAPVPDIFQGKSGGYWGDSGKVAAAPRATSDDAFLKGNVFGQQRGESRVAPRMVWIRLLSAMAEEFPERMLALPAAIGRVTDVSLRPSARNGLFLSTYLSRNHALIKMDAGRVVIEDLGSCNGTYVNGQQVLPGDVIVLSDRDIIQFDSEDLSAPGMFCSPIRLTPRHMHPRSSLLFRPAIQFSARADC